ncbi:MAG: hypothetical protein ABH886_04195 [Candidatus Desantisbacteria bacterium]
MKVLILISLIIFISISPSFAVAQDVSNREVITEITGLKIQVGKLETKMEEALKAMDKRIDDMNNDMNNRMSDMNNRMSDMNNRMSDMMGLMHVILAGMVALIGFILWDRRTAIAPVVRQAKELERDKAVVWDVLREYAKKEPRFAEVLRTAGML